jgi:predicted ferric reductase
VIMDQETVPAMPPLPLSTLLTLLLAAVAGAGLAVIVLPIWLPGLLTSLLGSEAKAYWHLARASALVAYLLLWLAMVFGLLLSSKSARSWLSPALAFDLHQYTSLLGLAFALFHALILLGDQYLSLSLRQLLLPFSSLQYRPLGVGLGQLAFYLLALVGLSFYVRQLLTQRYWRLIHFLSFLTFFLALLHGLLSGSDTENVWVRWLYWGTGGSLLFLSIYRWLLSRSHR